jgi:hypothetical protein
VPGKTNTETIRELEIAVATLLERVDNLREIAARLDAPLTKTAESLMKVDKQVAVLEENLQTCERPWKRATASAGC